MENQDLFTYILKNIVETQLCDEKIFKILDEKLNNTDCFKNNHLPLYLTLNLSELFKIENLWVKTSQGYLIEFDEKKIHQIRTHGKTFDGKVSLGALFQTFIGDTHIIKEFHKHLIELFPGVEVSEGSCYWFEKDSLLDYKFYISIPFNS
jgi:hypothetical protein